MAKFCEMCGEALSERAKFCAECGEKVLPKDSGSAAEPTPVTPPKKIPEPEPIIPIVETIKEKPSVEAQGFSSPPPRRLQPKKITPPPIRKPAEVTPPPIKQTDKQGFTPPPTKKTARTAYMSPIKVEAKREKVKDSYYDAVKPDDADKEIEKEKIDTKKMAIAIGIVAGAIIIATVLLAIAL